MLHETRLFRSRWIAALTRPVLIGCALLMGAASDQGRTQPVDIPNAELRESLERHLGVPGRAVTRQNLSRIQLLSLTPFSTSDTNRFEGLQYATNLTRISGVVIDDQTSIPESLIALQRLDISQFDTTNTGLLRSFTNLESLSLVWGIPGPATLPDSLSRLTRLALVSSRVGDLAGFQFPETLQGLTALTLSGEGAEALLTNPSNLERLPLVTNLDINALVSPEFRFSGPLTNLTTLRMRVSPNVPLDPLVDLPKLTTLSLQAALNVTNAVAIPTRLPALNYLALSGSTAFFGDLLSVTQLPSLRRLALSVVGRDVSHRISIPQGLTHLDSLGIFLRSPFEPGDPELEVLFPDDLTSLSTLNCPLVGGVRELVRRQTGLTRLSLDGGFRFNETADLSFLDGMPRLASLDVRGFGAVLPAPLGLVSLTNFSSSVHLANLDFLADCPQLHAIRLYGGVTNLVLNRPLPRVRWFSLQVGPDNILNLDCMTNLPSLEMLSVSLHSESHAVAASASFPQIRNLVISGATLATDFGFLARFPALEVLVIRDSDVGDLSIPPNLTRLRQMGIPGSTPVRLSVPRFLSRDPLAADVALIRSWGIPVEDYVSGVHLGRPHRREDGMLELEVDAPAGEYRLQTSGDFRSWTGGETVNIGSDPEVVVVPDGAEAEQQFFRVRSE